MNKFLNYLDPSVPLEKRLRWVFDDLQLPSEQREGIVAFLQPLKAKDHPTYEHTIRVGLLARRIARFMHLDEKALLYAGLLHDIGKAQTRFETLQKTEGWTPADTAEMKSHVMDGYRLVRGRFDFSAEIILWHHRFQPGAYPEELPTPLHEYSLGTKTLIPMYGRMLSLADTFDALHRVNDKHGDKPLTGEQIREKMLAFNKDQKILIEELFRADVFTTYLVDNATASERPLDDHDRLYLDIWGSHQKVRTPEETARHIMLATSLEPLSDKSGCTTRHCNITHWQKLEYFIAGAINIGDVFRDLLVEVNTLGKQPQTIYNYALRAQKESKRNRRGGRVNQGIIELLTPIVVAEHVYNMNRNLSIPAVLARATEVLKRTGTEDVKCLEEMKRFAFDLSGYFDRPVPSYADAHTVMEYYEFDKQTSTKATSIAHNTEFTEGFPTIIKVCEAFGKCELPGLNNRAEIAFAEAATLHPRDVARGFLADCVAVGMYLELTHNPLGKFVT